MALRYAGRELLVLHDAHTRVRKNDVYFVPCNKIGREGEWDFMGSSMIVDPVDEVVTELGAAPMGLPGAL